MFTEFFGNYLLNKGVIDKTVLEDVLNYKKEVRPQLGILAIDAGYMTAKQVEEVHQLQMERDRKFGEIAIIEMYLKPKELEKLLAMQPPEYLVLAQVLLEHQLLDMKTYEAELNLYKDAYGLSDEQFDALKNGHVDNVIDAYLGFLNMGHKALFTDYAILLYKNFVRFIDASVHLEKSGWFSTQSYEVVVSQSMFDESGTYYTALAGTKEVLTAFAGLYAKEQFFEYSPYAIDATGEFLNLHNGLFTVNMSDKSKEIELRVQSVEIPATLVLKGELYKIPFFFAFGQLDVIIGKLKG